MEAKTTEIAESSNRSTVNEDLLEDPDDNLVEDIEEVEDVNECNNDEVESTRTFSSPEAGATRLGKLPPNVLVVLQLLDEETMFNALITELQNRCQECRTTLPVYDTNRMWIQMVFSYCMNFRREKIFSESGTTQDVPPEVLEYMHTTPIVSILQTFVDLAQQTGFQAQQFLDTLENEAVEKFVSIKDHDDACSNRNNLQRRYHDYVDLFRHCTGTWKPARKNFRRSDAPIRGVQRSAPSRFDNHQPERNTHKNIPPRYANRQAEGEMSRPQNNSQRFTNRQTDRDVAPKYSDRFAAPKYNNPRYADRQQERGNPRPKYNQQIADQPERETPMPKYNQQIANDQTEREIPRPKYNNPQIMNDQPEKQILRPKYNNPQIVDQPERETPRPKYNNPQFNDQPERNTSRQNSRQPERDAPKYSNPRFADRQAERNGPRFNDRQYNQGRPSYDNSNGSSERKSYHPGSYQSFGNRQSQPENNEHPRESQNREPQNIEHQSRESQNRDSGFRQPARANFSRKNDSS